MKKKNIGSSVDSWLREGGIYEQVSAPAIKRVLARQAEADKIAEKASRGEDVSRYFTNRFTVVRPVQRASRSRGRRRPPT